jgi:hypothetical protein
MKNENTINHRTPPDAKPVLSAGFRSIREQKRFAKLLTYAVIYQQGGDWDEQVITNTRDYCETQVGRLGFPDGWGGCGSYEELKRWFFQACR